jgi:hypothetical protein
MPRRKSVPCDGSCFVEQRYAQEIPCEDGETLRFYLCFHERLWVLMILAPVTR